MARRSPSSPGTPAVTFTGTAAVTMRRAITLVVFLIAGLAFAFSFGAGRAVGLQLGVPSWMAPLVAPAVDLSVIVLLGSIQYLRANGVEGRLLRPRLLLIFCGLVTLGLNITQPVLAGEYGRAAFDAISPLLLIFWSEVGPGLLAALHRTVPGPSGVVPDGQAGVAPELIEKARQLDAEHRQQHGRPITRDRLRAGLKVSNAVAGEVLRQVRSMAQGL
jgi:Protein of unknown function (DUF2637)